MADSYKYNYIESNPVRTFVDLNFVFTKHPISGDVTKKTNEEAIKQNMRSLILLGKNEKPFHSEIYGGIYEMLFENMGDVEYGVIIEDRIKKVLNAYEPRADVRKVKVDLAQDRNGLNVTVYFVVVNTLEPAELNMFLKTVR